MKSVFTEDMLLLREERRAVLLAPKQQVPGALECGGSGGNGQAVRTKEKMLAVFVDRGFRSGHLPPALPLARPPPPPPPCHAGVVAKALGQPLWNLLSFLFLWNG